MIVFALLFLLILFEFPIAWSLAITGTAYMIYSNLPLSIIPQTMYSAVDSFALIAVPLFIASGNVMVRGGLSKRIVNVANALVGHIYGGFASTGALACAFFGAISGSANATAAAIGGITIPSMVERGYKKAWSTAFIACAAIVGVLIPPSIPFILYGASAGVSIGRLFVGGIIPGLIIASALCLYAYFYARKTGEGKEHRKFSFKQFMTSMKEGIWALGMPVIILGGVFSGIFTPSEAAGVGLLYGIIISVFIYKELKLKDLPLILGDSMIITATIMLIIMGASMFGWVLTAEQLPQSLVNAMVGITQNPILIMLILNVVFLILGTFFETCAAIVMMTPIVLPLVQAVGIDPLYFGVVMITNLAIGMVTPPLGVVLFVSCGISSIKPNETFRHLFPMLGILIGVLLLITLIPNITTYLPRLLIR